LKYLLDTNICVYLLNGNIVLKNKIAQVGLSLIVVSNATLSELYFGAYNSTKVAENLQRIALFKKNLGILSDSEESAMLFGSIKADLKLKGCMIEDFDILIASIAIANRCIIVTNNDKHFSRIEGLSIENWLVIS
jgi:tRNA(fMet)-specific endonuclease VapC